MRRLQWISFVLVVMGCTLAFGGFLEVENGYQNINLYSWELGSTILDSAMAQANSNAEPKSSGYQSPCANATEDHCESFDCCRWQHGRCTSRCGDGKKCCSGGACEEVECDGSDCVKSASWLDDSEGNKWYNVDEGWFSRTQRRDVFKRYEWTERVVNRTCKVCGSTWSAPDKERDPRESLDVEIAYIQEREQETCLFCGSWTTTDKQKVEEMDAMKYVPLRECKDQ